MQQRKAASGILRWCESQDEVKVTGNTVRAAAGEHLDWVRAMISDLPRPTRASADLPLLVVALQYLNRALAHHMQHALDLEQLPLTDDAEAQRWCSHEETLVRAAVLHAVGRDEFVRTARRWLHR